MTTQDDRVRPHFENGSRIYFMSAGGRFSSAGPAGEVIIHEFVEDQLDATKGPDGVWACEVEQADG
jgi:hypothetical protein